jgi:hypothetical protein
MAAQFPDPTRSEARALIVGLGLFWALWGVGALSMPGVGPGLVAFPAAMMVGLWAYVGGVFHIAARSQGLTVSQWYFSHASRPWTAWRDKTWIGWWRLLLPSYLRRASRVLGWNEKMVLGVLGTLLVVDLAAFVRMMSTAPTAH